LITFPNIVWLIKELKAFQAIVTGSRVRYSAPDGQNDDGVVSMALAVWGIRGDIYKVWKEEKQKDKHSDFWDMVKKDLNKNDENNLTAIEDSAINSLEEDVEELEG
jgi:hypothetical protein